MDKTQILRDSSVPLYQQIKQLLLQQIEAGVLPPHSGLPSERELVQQLGVSRITVRQALSELVQQGILYTTPSKGFYISEPERTYELNALLSFSALARERGLEPTSRILECNIIPATPALALQLLIEPGAEVVSLTRLRFLNDTPVLIGHSWLPHERCPQICEFDLEKGSLFSVLREQYGLRLTRSFTTISARAASEQEIKWLDMEPPGVVLTMEQTTFSQNDRPVELSLMLIHPKRYPLSLTHSDNGMALRPMQSKFRGNG